MFSVLLKGMALTPLLKRLGMIAAALALVAGLTWYVQHQAVQRAKAKWEAELLIKTQSARIKAILDTNKQWEAVLAREREDRAEIEALNEELRIGLNNAQTTQIEDVNDDLKILPCNHPDVLIFLDGLRGD